MHITYQLEPNVSVDEFLDVLKRSTLASRRPVEERIRFEGMLSNADVIITARAEGQLVGISRAITDFSYCTYLSDLAVAVEFQRRGIGRELVRRTHEAAGLNTALILLAAPQAESYYPHIGMQPHHAAGPLPASRAPAHDVEPNSVTEPSRHVDRAGAAVRTAARYR